MAAKYIKEAADGFYEEKKSRFISTIFPLSTEEDALARIQEVRKRYYDARHHCFAYVIGAKNEISRQSDDGEPSQTAGMPILNVLLGNDIHNALIIVTRYFGGTLLGTGGLVRAYTSAAKDAVEHAELLTLQNGFRVSGEIPYTLVGKIKYMAETMQIREESSEYTDKVKMTWLIPEEKKEQFETQIRELSGGSVSLAMDKAQWYNL